MYNDQRQQEKKHAKIPYMRGAMDAGTDTAAGRTKLYGHQEVSEPRLVCQ